LGLCINFASDTIWDGLTNDFKSLNKAWEREKEIRTYKADSTFGVEKKVTKDEACVKRLCNSLPKGIEAGVFDGNGSQIRLLSFDLIDGLKKNGIDAQIIDQDKIKPGLTQLEGRSSESGAVLIGRFKPTSTELTKNVSANDVFANSKLISAEVEVHFMLFDPSATMPKEECSISSFGFGYDVKEAEGDALNRIFLLFEKNKQEKR
jgi:hypothetical protein